MTMQHTIIFVTMNEWEAKREKIRARPVINIVLTKKGTEVYGYSTLISFI